MTHWESPAWDPPVVGGDRTTDAPARAEPRLPPATTPPRPTPAPSAHQPEHARPAQPMAPVPLVPAAPTPRRPRVPVWIWWGAACVAAAGALAIARSGADSQRAQFAPGGVAVTGAQPSATTIVVPPTTAPPTTAGTIAGRPTPTTIAVRQLLPQPACHPSYSPCVPVADDVDCAGGGGDGPEYVSGPIRVLDVDDYRLDHDGDGIACER